MIQIINTAKQCTIRAYMAAGFEGNMKVLIIDGEPSEAELLEAFEAIHEEYISLAGVQQSGDYILIKQIKYLRTRLESIGNFIKIHRICLAQTGEPFHPAIKDLKKLGHKLSWDPKNPDILKFLKALEAIQRKERRTEAELLNKYRALEVMRQKEKAQEVTDKQSRTSFISLLNNLGKSGYQIDRDKTTMEDLAIMVKDYMTELEMLKNTRKK